MTLRAAAYENGDHTCLIWFPDDLRSIPECRGFAIMRKRTKGDGTSDDGYLRNYVGFADGAQPPAPGQEWQWPIQRYLWWDYGVHPGDTVSYQIVPVTGPAANLQRQPGVASTFTAPLTVTGQISPHISAYFNKGIIAAQWVARELADEAGNQAAKKTSMLSVIRKTGDPLRNALGGLLREQILAELDKVSQNDGSIYAALYELNDPELLAAFRKLGAKVNLILGNGAFKPPSTDENEQVRADLKKLSTIKVYDRIVGSGHFAHNKFVVFCDGQGTPTKVLSGSTNWTVTGLCTQANNGLFIEDAKVAGAFRDEWDRLKAAGNAFPAALVQANSLKKSFTVDGAQVTTWFAPTGKQQDMAQARALIEEAKDAALFLFFNPGKFAEGEDQQTLLQTVIDRGRKGKPHFDAGLYIRGVVNQKIAGLTDDDTPPTSGAKGKTPAKTTDEQDDSHDPQAPTTPVLLFADGTQPPLRAPKDVLVPAAIKAKFGHWEPELLSMGVMVHSKVVVLDPFGEHPVVMTGSHNLGTKASRANDDNLVIVEGPGARGLAIAYAVNIIAIFQEYRWRTYVAGHASDPNAWHGLQDDDKWQDGHLTNDKDELQFWIGGAKSSSQVNQAKVAALATPPAAAVTSAPTSRVAAKKRKAPAKKVAPRKKMQAKKAVQAKSTSKPAAKTAARKKATGKK
ncbi:MAG: phospholipase D-like domain-containing protein [Betaproteobacteria bacterium]